MSDVPINGNFYSWYYDYVSRLKVLSDDEFKCLKSPISMSKWLKNTIKNGKILSIAFCSSLDTGLLLI